jgi:Protein of unknown function (DUF3489)
VVAAMAAANPEEISMHKPKSKRKTALRSNHSKTKARHSSAQPAAHKPAKRKPVAAPAIVEKSRSASRQTGRANSKQARIIAMLRAPGGATIAAMAKAAEWQPHSVRGFLAGIVRKKLGLTLVSASGDNGRVYRITERASAAAA